MVLPMYRGLSHPPTPFSPSIALMFWGTRKVSSSTSMYHSALGKLVYRKDRAGNHLSCAPCHVLPVPPVGVGGWLSVG